jgi:hypothetical protein
MCRGGRKGSTSIGLLMWRKLTQPVLVKVRSRPNFDGDIGALLCDRVPNSERQPGVSVAVVGSMPLSVGMLCGLMVYRIV